MVCAQTADALHRSPSHSRAPSPCPLPAPATPALAAGVQTRNFSFSFNPSSALGQAGVQEGSSVPSERQKQERKHREGQISTLGDGLVLKSSQSD